MFGGRGTQCVRRCARVCYFVKKKVTADQIEKSVSCFVKRSTLVPERAREGERGWGFSTSKNTRHQRQTDTFWLISRLQYLQHCGVAPHKELR